MSRLSDLYQAIETLRKEGLMINEDLEKQVSELEEEIIKKEILPIITETIAPALEPVKRELVLVVDHVPGAPLSVHISRKRNFAEVITDAKEITPDPQVEHTTSTINNPSTSIADRTGLRITFADGRVIQERKALETLRQFVILVGVMNVRALGLKCCKVPLVSNTLDDRYQYTQKPVGNGWYLMTHSSTKEKKRQIEKIAKALNIDVKVEII